MDQINENCRPEPRTRNPEPRSRNLEPGTRNPEPRTFQELLGGFCTVYRRA